MRTTDSIVVKMGKRLQFSIISGMLKLGYSYKKENENGNVLFLKDNKTYVFNNWFYLREWLAERSEQ